MLAHRNLIDDLEVAISAKNLGRKAEILRRVADLFVSGSAAFSNDHIALFDDIMDRLVREIDISARAAFGHWLGDIDNAPPNTLRRLALDDAIEVSGSILLQSTQLSEATVVEAASTKSQDHLLAISRRSSIPEVVTDVLVDRGNRQVALSTAANCGARFSEYGYSTLVTRAETEDGLALCVWSRPEVPRQHLVRLFADASEAVRLNLEAADRGKAELIREMVVQASNQIQAKARARSPDHAAIYHHVRSLHNAGTLDETQLSVFANDMKFDATAIALALMCDLPINLTERLLVQQRTEQTLVIARALGLSWDTTEAILVLQTSVNGDANGDPKDCQARFVKLTPELAKKALNFYRMRERASINTHGNGNSIN